MHKNWWNANADIEDPFVLPFRNDSIALSDITLSVIWKRFNFENI